MKSERTLDVLQTLIFGVIASWLASRIDHTPVIVLIAGFIGSTVFGLAIALNLPRYILSLFSLEAIVVSALVFDGNDVLLVKDDWRQPPWLVPPSAHLGCLTALKGGPHRAVVREVSREAGIDIEIVGPHKTYAGTTELPHPFFAQSEHQWFGEGHSIHHDFYYIATVVGERRVTKAKRPYEWVRVGDLESLKGMAIPHEMIKVINEAFASVKQPTSG